MRKFFVSLIQLLRTPVPEPLWLVVLIFIWMMSNLIEDVRNDGHGRGLLYMAVGLLLIVGGEWGFRRASDYVNHRTLPRQWEYSGHTLTLARDGPVVRGEVDGVMMVAWNMSETPYFAGSEAIDQFQRVLERVADIPWRNNAYSTNERSVAGPQPE